MTPASRSSQVVYSSGYGGVSTYTARGWMQDEDVNNQRTEPRWDPAPTTRCALKRSGRRRKFDGLAAALPCIRVGEGRGACMARDKLVKSRARCFPAPVARGARGCSRRPSTASPADCSASEIHQWAACGSQMASQPPQLAARPTTPQASHSPPVLLPVLISLSYPPSAQSPRPDTRRPH